MRVHGQARDVPPCHRTFVKGLGIHVPFVVRVVADREIGNRETTGFEAKLSEEVRLQGD
jgi:hypothetical protein